MRRVRDDDNASADSPIDEVDRAYGYNHPGAGEGQGDGCSVRPYC